jgi:chorismate synthase
MREFVIREFANPREFEASRAVAMAAWRLDLTRVSVPADLIAVTHAGGLTAGAFEGRRLVGFVHGIPRVDLAASAQHSHLLAVDPRSQGKGLSILLKLFQREWCLARGIRLVTWTYDPLLVKNARLNLYRLGATARAYVRDFYGHIGGIYGAVPTDRFEVSWDLRSARVRSIATGRLPPEPPTAGLARVVLGSRRIPRRLPARFGVEIPLAGGAILSRDPAGARRERLRLRAVAEDLFGRGFGATTMALEGERAIYVFEK